MSYTVVQMQSEFSSSFFVNNRRGLLAAYDHDGPIVLAANGLIQRSTDTPHQFKQDGSFWYMTGINEPNVVLVIDSDREYIIIPQLSPTRVAFDGAIDIEALKSHSGITEVLYEKEGWKRLGDRLKKADTVGTLLAAPAYIDALGMYTNPARARAIKKMKRYNPALKLVDMRQIVGKMRMVKRPEEIKTITRAVQITGEALNKIHQNYLDQKYAYEYEIELELTQAFWTHKASGHSFDAIVASGKKGSTIHPTGNTGKIDYNSSLLLDVGAEYDHYAADISRTWSRKPGKRFTEVYAAVKETADYAMSLLKPGVVMREYEKQVAAYMGEKLRHLGLITTTERENVRLYFPHSTSHFLGIDVHDVGDYEQPLEPGVVMTVEPGIYIPSEGVGVRIEDDVLITVNGCKNLSGLLAR